MGIAPSGNYACQITDQALEGIPNVVKSVDDALCEDRGRDPKALIATIEHVLLAFRKHGIIASAKKLHVGSSDEFGDSIIVGGAEGVQITLDPQRIKVLREIRQPHHPLQSILNISKKTL